MEISRILDSILEDRDTLTASLPADMMFLSKLVYVEPVRGYMMVQYSDHKPANSAALAARSLTLRCSHRNAQYAFSCGNPRQAVHAGQPAIQLGLPTAVLAMQQRRTNHRVQLPAQAQIHCDIRMGVLEFDAKVVDVSLDGIGTLLSDGTIPVCAGTKLERVRIRNPGHEPIVVDLEVRNVSRVQLDEGRRASRIGCQILGTAKDLEDLVRLFIIDLQ